MRTPIVVAAGLLAVGLTVAPASAASPTSGPTPASTVTHSPAACPLDAKAETKAAGVIAEVMVTQPARRAADGTLVVPVLVQDVLKGVGKRAPASLVATGAGCASRILQAAQPKDVLLVLGTVKGTQLRLNGATPSVLVGDQACQVERVLRKPCAEATTGVVFNKLSPSDPPPWLKIAAPGLAAVIVSVLGLLLLRLRRR